LNVLVNVGKISLKVLKNYKVNFFQLFVT